MLRPSMLVAAEKISFFCVLRLHIWQRVERGRWNGFIAGVELWYGNMTGVCRTGSNLNFPFTLRVWQAPAFLFEHATRFNFIAYLRPRKMLRCEGNCQFVFTSYFQLRRLHRKSWANVIIMCNYENDITGQSNLCTVFISLRNPRPDHYIVVSVLHSPRSTCSKSPFEQFENNHARLHGLFHWSHNTGLGSDPLRTRTDISLRGLGLDRMAEGERFSVFLESCIGTHQQYGPSVVLLQDDLFLLQTFLSRSELQSFRSV
jgi:hypothetical protein